MLKWRLMITTLPFVAAVAGLKAVLEYGLHFPGVVDFGDVGIVLTAGVFLTGFLLAGTMADYKESEKLPGELACTLETLEEVLVLGVLTRPALTEAQARQAVQRLGRQVKGWLLRAVPHEGVFAALTELLGFIHALEQQGGGSYASRAVSELHNLRKTVTRVGVISRTGFLPPAYAILETLTVLIVALLLASHFKSPLAEFILVPFATLINVYMLRLIKDIDDPFEYAPDGRKVGGAEVELFPLDEYLARLEARVSGTSSTRAPPP
jgi:hypothetical protein